MGFLDRDDEEYDSFVEMQMTASSRQEAIDLTGDDTFYLGGDELEDEDDEDDGDDEDDLVEELELAGLDIDELEDMDEDERREALEDAGLDPDDYADIFE